jgi:glycerophosphoryl diester phosphodiesterase
LPTRRAKAAQAYIGGVTLITAHRGASAIAPENSLEAFEKAIGLGADMVEFDVRRTADGVLVVVHDPLPPVRYDELRPRPPRFEEVVDVCAGRIALDVELKEPGVEAEVLDVVDAASSVVTSFLPDVVAAVKTLRPDVRAGLLLREGAAVPFSAPGDFLAPHFTLVDRGLDVGSDLYVWTVNDEARLTRYLSDPRLTAVITDDPALAISLQNS